MGINLVSEGSSPLKVVLYTCLILLGIILQRAYTLEWLCLICMKSFDKVDQVILCIYKKKTTQKTLRSICVRSVDWFLTYLYERKQYVSNNGISSDAGIITCGVLQGSILCPLLFFINANDMLTSVDTHCKLILCANDSAILFGLIKIQILLYRNSVNF
jgi:hypothetical protein